MFYVEFDLLALFVGERMCFCRASVMQKTVFGISRIGGGCRMPIDSTIAISSDGLPHPMSCARLRQHHRREPRAGMTIGYVKTVR
jgi:hypothetical protein